MGNQKGRRSRRGGDGGDFAAELAEQPFRHIAALRLIEAACRYESYTLAGRELGVSHAAVSQAVSRVEALLGEPLFAKIGGAMKPTPAGLDLAEAFRSAERAVTRAWERRRADPGGPRLGLAAPLALLLGWLGQRIGQMSEGLPGLNLNSYSGRSGPDFTLCDAALLLVPAPPAHLVGEVLWRETLTPVCAPELAAQLAATRPADLGMQTLLIDDPQAWPEWFAAAGATPVPRKPRDIILDDPASSIGLALVGRGVALASVENVGGWLAAGRLVAPFETRIPTGRALHICWPRDAPVRADIHRLIDWLRLEALRGALPDAPLLALGLNPAVRFA